MATRIRLTKTGKKHQPSYRVVVIDSRVPRDGAAIETLGYYNPSLPQPEFKIDKDKYEAWIGRGAKPSEAVVDLVAGTYTFKPYRKAEEKTETVEKEEKSQEEKEEDQKEVTEEEPQKIEEVAEAEEVSKEEENEKQEETEDAGTA